MGRGKYRLTGQKIGEIKIRFLKFKELLKLYIKQNQKSNKIRFNDYVLNCHYW